MTSVSFHVPDFYFTLCNMFGIICSFILLCDGIFPSVTAKFCIVSSVIPHLVYVPKTSLPVCFFFILWFYVISVGHFSIEAPVVHLCNQRHPLTKYWWKSTMALSPNKEDTERLMHRVLFDRDVCVSYISCWRYSLLLHVSSATNQLSTSVVKGRISPPAVVLLWALGICHLKQSQIVMCWAFTPSSPQVQRGDIVLIIDVTAHKGGKKAEIDS